MSKTVIISGTSRGIGLEVAKEFIKYNYKVIGLDRSEPKGCIGSNFFFIKCDLYNFTKENECELISLLEAKMEKLILINNAAYQYVDLFEKTSLDSWKKTFFVNLFAPVQIINCILPYLAKSNGSIVNISSIHAKLTKKGFSAYAASKSSIETLTRSLALEFGQKGIRVNAISPAAIETEMLLDGFQGDSNKLQELNSHHPVNFIGKCHYLSKLVFNLSTSDDLFWTGSIINYDGGISSALSDPDNRFEV